MCFEIKEVWSHDLVALTQRIVACYHNVIVHSVLIYKSLDLKSDLEEKV
jgi:hypothetical protein